MPSLDHSFGDLHFRPQIPDDVDEGEDPITWIEDDDMEDLTRARLLAIKILTNRCLAYAETDSATQVSVPVFELLWPLVSQGEGESQYSCVLIPT